MKDKNKIGVIIAPVIDEPLTAVISSVKGIMVGGVVLVKQIGNISICIIQKIFFERSGSPTKVVYLHPVKRVGEKFILDTKRRIKAGAIVLRPVSFKGI